MFLSSAVFFSKSTFSKNYFGNAISVSNNLNPDQAQHFVGPDLGTNCLQRLSAADKISPKKVVAFFNYLHAVFVIC